MGKWSDPTQEALDFARSFTVRDGRIASPGKFEGEAAYVPYMHSILMDGGGDWDTDDDGCVRYWVEAEDEELWPELRGVECVVLWYREDGFVQEVECKMAESK